MIGFLRRLYLKRTLKRVKQVGINAFIHESTEIYAPELLEIGIMFIFNRAVSFLLMGRYNYWRGNHICT